MNKTNCTSIWRLAGPGALVCYALLAPLSALCSTLFALSLQPVVDTGLSGDLARFGLACLAAFLLGAVDLALNHWTVCRQAALVHRCTNRLCQHYLHQTLAQKVERLQGQDSAVYLSKLTADAPLISSGYLGNALDPQTAGALMDTVLALEGVGLLAITHDLSGERLKRFDSILVLRDGSIIEQGSWEVLMARRGELYRLSVRP